MGALNIYLYPNTSNDDYLVDDARYGLSSAMDRVVANTSIPSYDIYERYDHPGVGDNSAGSFYDNFNSWIVGRYNDRGCHLGISDDCSGGEADGGNYTLGGAQPAWVDGREAVAGGSGNKYFENVCIQEVFHSAIDKGLAEVNTRIDNSEHDLGKVRADGKVTPMTTGYVGDGPAQAGSCSSTYSKVGYTNFPTSCTEEALEATYQYWF